VIVIDRGGGKGMIEIRALKRDGSNQRNPLSPHLVPRPGRSDGAVAYLAFRREDAIQEAGSAWELPARRESERDRHREKHTAIFHAIGSIGRIRA
jgi:hypothetical protein